MKSFLPREVEQTFVKLPQKEKITSPVNGRELILHTFVSSSGDEVTCGKFYASFLIQDYFKKFRKRKERERKSKRKDKAASLQVCSWNVAPSQNVN